MSATVVAIHDRFYDAKVPDWLGTFSGSLAGLPHQLFAVFALAAISAAIVPFVYAATETLRHALWASAPLAWGIFVFLNEHSSPWGCTICSTCRSTTDNLVINDGIYATWTNLLPILSHSTRPLNELAPWAGFTATGWVKLFLAFLPSRLRSIPHRKPERRAAGKVILVPAIVASVWSAASPNRLGVSLYVHLSRTLFALCRPILSRLP